jgi:hypothetical protein
MRILLLGLTGIAMLANAATFKLDLLTPSVVNGQELKPGEYKVSYDDQSVTFVSGKQSVTAPVRVEPAEAKIKTTAVRYTQSNDKLVQEIRIAGSTTKLVLESAHDTAAGGTR